jgi:hypothetical protein
MIISSYGGSSFRFLRIRSNGNVDAMRLKDGKLFPDVSPGKFLEEKPGEWQEVMERLKINRTAAQKLMPKGGFLKRRRN